MSSTDADRWLEIDLYWFDNVNLERSVRNFWLRFAPLMDEVCGWRGVIINTGWLADQILDWKGDRGAEIPFPSGLGKDKFFSDTSPLLGTDAERMMGWRARFDDRAERDTDGYQGWTYAQFAELATWMRDIALDEFLLPGIRVGTFVIGWDSTYACEPSE